MKNLTTTIEIGTELLYINSKGERELTTVFQINQKTFDCKNLGCGPSNNFYDAVQTFTLKSGKKASHRYNYGDIIEIIGKID